MKKNENRKIKNPRLIYFYTNFETNTYLTIFNAAVKCGSKMLTTKLTHMEVSPIILYVGFVCIE